MMHSPALKGGGMHPQYSFDSIQNAGRFALPCSLGQGIPTVFACPANPLFSCNPLYIALHSALIAIYE